jgi:hypothetical protein
MLLMLKTFQSHLSALLNPLFASEVLSAQLSVGAV